MESFKYYKNNIDNICILFDKYKTKIKNEILYNGSLEYKKVKENLLRIQREVVTVIKEILTIQTEFFKKKNIFEKLKSCITEVLQYHINKITDLSSKIRDSIESCDKVIEIMSKIENSFDEVNSRKLLLNHYEIIINNRNWDIRSNQY